MNRKIILGKSTIKCLKAFGQDCLLACLWLALDNVLTVTHEFENLMTHTVV